MNKYQEALGNLYKIRGETYKVYQKGKEWKEEIKKYDAVGENLHTLQELVDKATPKMVKKFAENAGDCPNCDRIVRNYNHSYCPYCGQALDWSGENEK